MIYLRGEVPDATRWTTLDRADPQGRRRARVENLTHLPGEPAPTKDETRSAPTQGGLAGRRIGSGHGRARDRDSGPRSRVQEGPARGRRDRPARGARRGVRLPRVRTAPGKSTTVHMLTTLLPPTSGRAWVAGHDVVEEGAEVRATIGAALQEAALDPFLTGREHMKLQTALHGMPGAEARERSDAAARARRARAGGRPPRGRLLGRHEAAARPGARARPPARASCSSTSPPPASTCRAAARSGRRCSGSRATAA